MRQVSQALTALIDAHRESQAHRAATGADRNASGDESQDSSGGELGDGGPRSSEFVRVMQGIKECLSSGKISKKNFA